MVYGDFRIYATSREDLQQLITLFSVITRCGKDGSCETLKVVVDGDGSGKYKFQVKIKGEDDDFADILPNNLWDTEKDAIWPGE